MKGKVINIRDGKPVAFASIGLVKKRSNVLSDASGDFRISLTDIINNDSLYITSIGYKGLKLSVKDAMILKEFGLYEQAKDLQGVVVKSYASSEAIGSKSEVTGYFRSWKTQPNGGEIGRTFYINHDDYKLEKVRFKLNNQCDTCLVRLHVREIVNEKPGEEIVYDSISTKVTRLGFDDKFAEFDLRPYELILKNRNIYVSVEVLNCSGKANENCTICFVGTEHGTYFYKNRKKDDWVKSENDYNIYMRLFYKY